MTSPRQTPLTSTATSEMPNLGVIVSNPTARKVIYGIYGVGAIAVGGLSAYTLALGDGFPRELIGAQAVVAYAGLLIATLGFGNTPKAGTPPLLDLPVAQVEYVGSDFSGDSGAATALQARVDASTETAPIKPLDDGYEGRHEA